MSTTAAKISGRGDKIKSLDLDEDSGAKSPSGRLTSSRVLIPTSARRGLAGSRISRGRRDLPKGSRSMNNKITQRIADELRVGAGQVEAAVGLLDEGATSAVHRSLPQGEDGRARRHAVAHTCRAPDLSARAGRPPRHRAQIHRGTRKLTPGLAALHQRRGDQG